MMLHPEFEFHAAIGAVEQRPYVGGDGMRAVPPRLAVRVPAARSIVRATEHRTCSAGPDVLTHD
jgi:hypothetical protein